MNQTAYRAPWIIAYQNGTHTLLKNGCVVVKGDTITHVGHGVPEDVDDVVETNSVISPGLISTHAHINESPVDKTIVEDANKRQFWNTSLIEILPIRGAAMTDSHRESCTNLSLAEHLRTGTTTVMHMGAPQDYLLEAIDRSGIRAYTTGSFRSGRWLTNDGKQVSYEWADDEGFSGLQRALDEVETIRSMKHPRIRPWLNPSQVDTCSENLLREAKKAADGSDVPITIHAAQSFTEFNEMTRRYGRTPIEWLADIGFLDERVMIGHGIFLGGTPAVNFHGDDLGLLADSGASVSYNAWTFARGGQNMFTYRKYLEAGVRVCLGTDSATQSMIESLRWTAVLGKVAEQRADGANSDEVFNSATVDAANYLGREDLGRIAPGAKADLLFFRTDSATMAPTRDPVKSIVYYAQPEDLTDVMVDGNFAVENGTVRGIDVARAAAEVQAAGEHIWESWPQGDWGGRTIDEHIPVSYPAFEESGS